MLDNTTHVIQFTDQSSVPDNNELASLGPGCYVQVNDGNNIFWAEIQSSNNGIYTGLIHYELENSLSDSMDRSLKTSEFDSSQIINLGCDNYCFC